MKLKIIITTFLIAVSFATSVALAETVEVDVTVKSVDVKARGITVVYETKSGQKSIDLDVSRKAEITINGEAGSLDSVKIGQKATVVYEKELHVVTKIVATGKGTEPGREVYRLTLQLSEYGDGKFRIEKTSDPAPDDFDGTPFKLSRWPKTKAKKSKDGLFQLVHDFSDADDLDLLAANGKKSGRVIETPGGEGFQIQNGAGFFYAKKLRLPITVTCDIVNHGGEQCGFHLYCQKLGELDSKFSTREPQLDSPFNVSGGWIETNGNGKRDATTLFEMKDVVLDHFFEKTFRLPLPNAKIAEPCTLALSNVMRDRPTTISRLEIRGRLGPIFGVEVDEKAGNVFAKKVAPNSLGERAGVQVGDVILAINGKKPKTMQEAVDMLSRVSIGEEVVFSVQRADQTKELRVTAE